MTDAPNPLPSKHGLALFVTADNLVKGAALNTVRIAEVLCSKVARDKT